MCLTVRKKQPLNAAARAMVLAEGGHCAFLSERM
jgi:hypothetical protein